MDYNIQKIRSYFPVLNQKVYNKPFVYFDNAASAQKPVQVLMTEERLHNDFYGNIHRAAHYMADQATVEFEAVRIKLQKFIKAGVREEIILTKGTTESVNLVAHSFGEKYIQEGDEIIVSEMEHHSNIVPWQLVAGRKNATVIKLPFTDSGELQLDVLEKLINHKTKIIALAHVSNVLGTINPVEKIVQIAHQKNVPVFIDGAQAVQHIPVDVQKLDADFYAFSAHKMYGPNGVGVLYGKRKWLDEMPPYQGGGEMISEVSFEKTTFNEIPYKFEAGTPNITSVVAFGSAIDLITEIGLQNIGKWEKNILTYAASKLKEISGIKIYGEAPEKSGVISFNVGNTHPYDIGMLLDKMGIAVRTGHHCADPVMQHYKVPGTIRISFGMYNTKEEVDLFIEALKKVLVML
ncbi:aminotransferase class V-fold PLP-dependent enzyme [Maribellus maritimus]|uniref:aminotransferase class V-fold PLP-dependent enzyme n=1 Tax=Maribellus maritimus TaxID=2870838 RepID=UPI001EE9CA16|nr:cysteine desulfurase [Maribellus maritimus]MCG6187410.1 cysteine desulfurase [Maribellus maritimus]